MTIETEDVVAAVARALSEAGGAADWEHALKCAQDAIAAIRATPCSCMEVYGEDPRCIFHGTGTHWAKQNPDLCALSDRIAEDEATIKLQAQRLMELSSEIVDLRARTQNTPDSERDG